MSNKKCTIEPLASSKYCHLSICLECNVIHLNLPSRISFQFGICQFLEIVDTFNKAAQILEKKTKPTTRQTARVIKLNPIN